MLPMAYPTPTRVGATGLASQSISLFSFRYTAAKLTQNVPSGLVSLANATKRRHLQCQVRYKTLKLSINNAYFYTDYTMILI
jgi:hypothetical protein